MLIFENFHYTGNEQRWQVPEGVVGGDALFECWGASGGVASGLRHYGKRRQTVGGTAPRNNDFTNDPTRDADRGLLGRTFANNAGYAAGTKAVEAGEEYLLFVGGNGGPGHSSIRRRWNDTIYARSRGGTGGFNGGGDGGSGSRTDRNTFNSRSAAVRFAQNALPGSADRGDLWLDIDSNRVRRARRKYSSGAQLSYWQTVTSFHRDVIGPSGGGGGGATDIRLNGESLTDRILVAGGGGGNAGKTNFTGRDRQSIEATPETPAPPFGADDVASGPTGPNQTWLARIAYLIGGWGRGGLGGASGPTANTVPTTSGGVATVGGSGGPSSNRHRAGRGVTPLRGSHGRGGAGIVGGEAGRGGDPEATDGGFGQGGQGAKGSARARNDVFDDWCAGGGGGGGGYFGGGGGGHGFRVGGSTYLNTDVRTHGGGGGGGSNYAGPEMDTYFLAGGARPPAAASGADTGANGRGGFARITYRLPPSVEWEDVPLAAVEGDPFSVSFRYDPPQADGSDIDYYVVGTGSVGAEFPASQTVVMVQDKTQREFTYDDFVGPTAGTTTAFFVKAVDVDGDSSAWLSQDIVGIVEPVPATITSPGAGSQFIDTEAVTWTLGSQSPLVAYRLGLRGDDIVTGNLKDFPSEWRQGGSRVNLATDPGFMGTAVWSSEFNTDLAPSGDFPGVSGSGGKIVWAEAEDEDAENHTTPFDNLTPNLPYRIHIEVASDTANDERMVVFEVEDENGTLMTSYVDMSGQAAGDYFPIDIPFTPTGQGVVLTLRPSNTGDAENPSAYGNADAAQVTYLANMVVEVAYSSEAVLAEEFPDADSLADWTPGANVGPLEWDPTGREEGNEGSVKITCTTTGIVNLAGSVLPATEGLTYRLSGWLFGEVASRMGNVTLNFLDGGGGIVGTTAGSSDAVPLDDWIEVTVEDVAPPGTVSVQPFVQVTDAVLNDVFFADDIHLRSVVAPAYFDGANLNGNEGSVAWYGGANASESVLTGADVTGGTLTVEDTRLADGTLYLDTLTDDAIVLGSERVRAEVSVLVNPSIPATPVVALEVNNLLGLMVLTIDADDGVLTNKTISFDVFRNDVRIATGLTPDGVTRQVAFADTPAHNEAVSYRVRAIDSSHGYADTADGTVTTVD